MIGSSLDTQDVIKWANSCQSPNRTYLCKLPKLGTETGRLIHRYIHLCKEHMCWSQEIILTGILSIPVINYERQHGLKHKDAVWTLHTVNDCETQLQGTSLKWQPQYLGIVSYDELSANVPLWVLGAADVVRCLDLQIWFQWLTD